MNALQTGIREAVCEAAAPLRDELDRIRKMLDKAIVGKDDPLVPWRDGLAWARRVLRRKIREGEPPCKRIGKKIFQQKRNIYQYVTQGIG